MINLMKRGGTVKTILMALILLLGGCAVGLTPEQLRQQTMDYVEMHDRPDFVRDALLNLQPAKGMNESDIHYLYGLPVRINEASYGTQHVYRTMCQYSRSLYQDRIYIYFEDGIVTGWQINDCIY